MPTPTWGPQKDIMWYHSNYNSFSCYFECQKDLFQYHRPRKSFESFVAGAGANAGAGVVVFK